jgi:hypothetical protein
LPVGGRPRLLFACTLTAIFSDINKSKLIHNTKRMILQYHKFKA